MRVPFVDLAAQHNAIKEEIDAATAQVVASGRFIQSPPVAQFEKAWAAAVGCREAVGVGNGTDALFAIIKCLGLSAGDEVITPAWSWISSASMVSMAGAVPVFADVCATSYTLDPDDVARKITPRTRAIVAVHLYGRVANMPPLLALAREHRLWLIEDCAQAHLAAGFGSRAGQFGVAAAFSFYPTKNLGALGDAGAVLTNDGDLALRIRRFANHGGLTKDEHLATGINSRLDALQAAVLSAKLPHLPQWNHRRSAHAAHYHFRLGHLARLQLPPQAAGHAWHLFVVRSNRRDHLRQFLQLHEIDTQVHYPRAIPFEPAYAHLRCRPADFPVAAALQHEVLSLPVYPELSQAQIDFVCDTIEQYYAKPGTF